MFTDDCDAVNNVKCSFAPAPGDQFKAMVGEEFTEMLQYFAEFGCRFPPYPYPPTLLVKGADTGLVDYGGKDIEPSQAVLPETAKVQTWADFVKASDWSKTLSG
jgi:hypothetical protein